jgi:hypothetical protein
MCWSSGSAARHRPRGGAKRPFHLLLHCMGPVVARSVRAAMSAIAGLGGLAEVTRILRGRRDCPLPEVGGPALEFSPRRGCHP